MKKGYKYSLLCHLSKIDKGQLLSKEESSKAPRRKQKKQTSYKLKRKTYNQNSYAHAQKCTRTHA